MKIKNHWILVLTALTAPLLQQCGSDDENGRGPVPTEYSNPVIRANVPDPTVIEEDGYFYLYCTEGSPKNIPIYRSANLVDWDLVSTAFSDATRPSFFPGGTLWAPCINRIDGQYVMYYALSEWGGYETCGIGCAVSDQPSGPFTDMGAMLRSNIIGVRNSIDPCYIEDEGRKYMFFGSFFGIYGVELTDDGLKVREGSQPRQIAGTAYEGTYILKRNGYYYLFASIGRCCDGLNSTYTAVVGRAESLWGPYMNKAGERMMDNAHEIFITKNDTFFGVGHDSEIVQDKAGNDWILYHGYEVMQPTGRRLLLDRVEWEDGWPRVKGASPSITAERPVF